jgi:YD repeat-containing protein
VQRFISTIAAFIILSQVTVPAYGASGVVAFQQPRPAAASKFTESARVKPRFAPKTVRTTFAGSVPAQSTLTQKPRYKGPAVPQAPLFLHLDRDHFSPARFRSGEAFRLVYPHMLPLHRTRDPLAMHRLRAQNGSLTAFRPPALNSYAATSATVHLRSGRVPRAGRQQVPTVASPPPGGLSQQVLASSDAGAGLQSFWTYASHAIPGIGVALANVGAGNLVITTSDLAIAQRGVNLGFSRTYNSQSLHDANGDDGDEPAVFGNGWTNNYDAHIILRSSGVMSVYDGNGTRCDYTPNNGNWEPCAGVHSTLEPDPNSPCAYWLVQTNGVAYYFVSPVVPCSNLQPGTTGHLYEILGRNINNYVTLAYSFVTGEPRTSQYLTQILVTHSDAQSLTLTFASLNNGAGPNELANITYANPKNPQTPLSINYSYDSSGDLQEVDRPGNEGSAILSETYGTQHPIQFACGPRATQSNSTAGACLHFDYDNSVNLIDWGVNGLLNFDPQDGYGVLQGGGMSTAWQRWYTANFVYGTSQKPCGTTLSGTTTMCDSDGHAAVWSLDSEDRVTQTQAFTGTSSSLITSQSWDPNNNLVATTDARGKETDYAYDANGNETAVGFPSVSDTTIGSYRPTILFSYDALTNNLLSICGPANTNALGKNWSGNPGQSDSRCPLTIGSPNAPGGIVLQYQTESAEPLGQLIKEYSPTGYYYTIAYSVASQGGDFGLPTNFAGQQFQENDSTQITPTANLTYDAYGDVATYGNGEGKWSYQYDTLNRLVQETDPTSVSSYVCYNLDSSVSYTSTALQYQLDGGQKCGGDSQPHYKYDPDEDLISDYRGYTAATTNRIYDGLDRLVEVQVPSDSNIDNGQTGTWRYLYDLSQHGPTANLTVGSVSGIVAYGDLYQIQRCVGFTNCSLQAFSGNAYDAANRPVERLQYSPSYPSSGNSPGGTPGPLKTWLYTYDAAGAQGSLSSASDPLGITTTLSYDNLGRLMGKTFSDGQTPALALTYDADGNVAVASSPGGSTETYSYDGNDLVTTYSEGGSISDPETLTYARYPNGWREQLAVSDPDVPFNESIQYNYRVDGNRKSLTVGSASFNWTYDTAGRELTESDPQTGTNIPSTDWNNSSVQVYNGGVTLQPRTASYDANGELSKLILPSGGTYSSISHDAVGEITGANIGIANFQPQPGGYDWYISGLQIGYDIRREFNQTQAQSPASNGYVFLQQLQTFSGHPVCVGPTGICSTTNNGLVDPNTGGVTQLPQVIDQNGCADTDHISYDADARQSTDITYTGIQSGCQGGYSLSDTRLYDAQNHTINDAVFGETRSFKWSPTGRLSSSALTAGGTTTTYTLHWDGSSLLFVTDPTGGVDELALEHLALKNSGKSGAPWIVYDRDFTGSAADEHTGTAFQGFSVSGNYYNIYKKGGQGIATIFGQYPGMGGFASSPVVDMIRTDGYNLGGLTFQGVRAYDSNAGQWTTPDDYAGDVSSPLSQMQYQWNAGNPITHGDPSGYYTSIITGGQSCDDGSGGNAQQDDSCGGSSGVSGGLSIWLGGGDWGTPGQNPGKSMGDGTLLNIATVRSRTVKHCPPPPPEYRTPPGGPDFSNEYQAGQENGLSPGAAIADLMHHGRFNFQGVSEDQYRQAGNFGLGVYAAGAGIPMWAFDIAIAGIGEYDVEGMVLRNDRRITGGLQANSYVARLIFQDTVDANNGYMWATDFCL